ncbi:MAG: hypothetical protein MHM6MM_008765, partial [Cercozoa sp. M6MM]
ATEALRVLSKATRCWRSLRATVHDVWHDLVLPLCADAAAPATRRAAALRALAAVLADRSDDAADGDTDGDTDTTDTSDGDTCVLLDWLRCSTPRRDLVAALADLLRLLLRQRAPFRAETLALSARVSRILLTLASARTPTPASARTLALLRRRRDVRAACRSLDSKPAFKRLAALLTALQLGEQAEAAEVARALRRLSARRTDSVGKSEALLSRASLGQLLGDSATGMTSVLDAFMLQLPLAGLPVDEALRRLCALVLVHGEAQLVDRIVTAFGRAYCHHNPGVFQSVDTPYVLSFGILMLNTDLYNSQVKRKMSEDDFIRNYGRLDGDVIDPSMLRQIYRRIAAREIKLSGDDEENESESDAVALRARADWSLARAVRALCSRVVTPSGALSDSVSDTDTDGDTETDGDGAITEISVLVQQMTPSLVSAMSHVDLTGDADTFDGDTATIAATDTCDGDGAIDHCIDTLTRVARAAARCGLSSELSTTLRGMLGMTRLAPSLADNTVAADTVTGTTDGDTDTTGDTDECLRSPVTPSHVQLLVRVLDVFAEAAHLVHDHSWLALAQSIAALERRQAALLTTLRALDRADSAEPTRQEEKRLEKRRVVRRQQALLDAVDSTLLHAVFDASSARRSEDCVAAMLRALCRVASAELRHERFG